ncbi:uncharacterized protein LOC103374518 [Stegastes partitus]|uniref:Uncharacterized protein LOC103374518 n=2 Tax=Stegastes partitus TaxID=144197 RepID=A0A9Y4NTH8_9TELE|nr:PREDICTED: uncharacterized protein LOC103374518 [Stegastes partitus]
MEVAALLLMLLVAHVQRSRPQTSGANVHIVPSRLQLFEYESVSFTCEGANVSTGWKVRSMKKFIQRCSNGTTLTCSIIYSFESDSGTYWCENGEQRSNAVNVTVTAGSVILESPVRPLKEGGTVTLGCRNKTTSSNFTADFYQDGRLVGSNTTGNLTIKRVSRSNGGFYKCQISGAEESPESWLTIMSKSHTGDDLTPESSVTKAAIPDYKGSVTKSEDSNTQQKHKTASRKLMSFSLYIYVLLWVSIVVVLALQLLVLGLLYWKKRLVQTEIQMSDPNKDMYMTPRSVKKKKDAADSLSFDLDADHSRNPEKDEDEPLPQTFHPLTGDSLQAL